MRPDKDNANPCEHKSMCYVKNVVKAKNVFIGDYTYYDDPVHFGARFEEENILFNSPEFGDKLVIGKFCGIAFGTQFMMGSANHRMDSISTYPFSPFGGGWEKNVRPHLEELPQKGDTVIGSDVWFGRECFVLPGVKIGDGAIIGAHSVVCRDVEPYTIAGGNPVRKIRDRFDEETKRFLLEFKWWDLPIDEIEQVMPLLTQNDIPGAISKLKEFRFRSAKTRV